MPSSKKFNLVCVLLSLFAVTATAQERAAGKEEPSVKVKGRVLLPDGSPAKNVFVFCTYQFRYSPHSSRSGSFNVQTDANGEYTTHEVPVGAIFGVSVSPLIPPAKVPSTYAAASITAEIALPLKPNQFDIQLQKEGVRIHGKVIYGDGTPVTEKNVLLTQFPLGKKSDKEGFDSFQRVFYIPTDKNGEFSFLVSPGEGEYELSRQEVPKQVVSVVLKPEDKEFVHNFTLPNPVKVRILLPGGSPARDLYVSISHLDFRHGSSVQSEYIRTDKDGYISTIMAPHEITVFKCASTDGKLGTVRIEPGVAKPFAITLQPPTQVKVRFVDASGKPLSDYEVSYHSQIRNQRGGGGSSSAGGTEKTIKTDKNGNVVLPMFACSEYVIRPKNVFRQDQQWNVVITKPNEVIDLGEKTITPQ